MVFQTRQLPKSFLILYPDLKLIQKILFFLLKSDNMCDKSTFMTHFTLWATDGEKNCAPKRDNKSAICLEMIFFKEILSLGWISQFFWFCFSVDFHSLLWLFSKMSQFLVSFGWNSQFFWFCFLEVFVSFRWISQFWIKFSVFWFCFLVDFLSLSWLFFKIVSVFRQIKKEILKMSLSVDTSFSQIDINIFFQTGKLSSDIFPN